MSFQISINNCLFTLRMFLQSTVRIIVRIYMNFSFCTMSIDDSVAVNITWQRGQTNMPFKNLYHDCLECFVHVRLNKLSKHVYTIRYLLHLKLIHENLLGKAENYGREVNLTFYIICWKYCIKNNI